MNDEKKFRIGHGSLRCLTYCILWFVCYTRGLIPLGSHQGNLRMTRRILLFAPLVLVAFLLQSYFWVPTYEEQAKGNPERLRDFITAPSGTRASSIPCSRPDSASSEIGNMVFEGLIDRDEELRFRGRVASSWDIHEKAYFYMNEEAVIRGRAG